MRFINKMSSENVDEENPYWMSFSDIMAGLLAIFMLASMALILEITKQKNDFENKINESIEKIIKAETVRNDILRYIQQTLDSEGIKVEIPDNDSLLRIPEETLTFDKNKHLIPEDPKVRYVLDKIGRILYQAIMYENRWQYLDTIFIEGHTDNKPVKKLENGTWVIEHRGNWDLSTRRAISVWTYWTQEAKIGEATVLPMKDIKNHEEKNLFSMSGYADSRLAYVCQEIDPECDKKNRRIDIRITVKKPTEEELKEIREAAK